MMMMTCRLSTLLLVLISVHLVVYVCDAAVAALGRGSGGGLKAATSSAGEGGGDYDSANNVFNPEGRLLQQEYATSLVTRGSLCLGLRCSDGVVLALDRLVHGDTAPLFSTAAPTGRLHRVDRHIALLAAGLPADGTALAAVAGDYALSYRRLYGEAMPARLLAEHMAAYMHATSIRWGKRPFPNALFIAGYGGEEEAAGARRTDDVLGGVGDRDVGAQLYVVYPNGVTYAYKAFCTGQGSKYTLGKLKGWDPSKVTCQQAVTKIAELIGITPDHPSTSSDEVNTLTKERGSSEDKNKQMIENEAAESEEGKEGEEEGGEKAAPRSHVSAPSSSSFVEEKEEATQHKDAHIRHLLEVGRVAMTDGDDAVRVLWEPIQLCSVVENE